MKVGVERDAGKAAEDALNSVTGGPRLISGSFDDHAVVTKLSASLDFQIKSITGSNLTLSNTTLLQHGQSLSGNIGATVALPSGPALANYPDHAARAGLLFGESQSRILITVAPENVDAVLAEIASLPHSRIGTVGGAQLALSAYRSELVATVAELRDTFDHSIGNAMDA